MSIIKTYDDYLDAIENSPTEMFWFIPDDVVVSPNFKFDIYFPIENDYDRKMNHVFLNGEHYDGVVLFSRHKKISKKEFNHRFFVEKKEWDLVASTPKQFDVFYIDTYEEYQAALEKTTTEMFWMTSRNLQPIEDFDFSFYISHHNTIDRNQNHAFIHRIDGVDSFNGIFLCSKHRHLTKKEVEHRFPIERKEWDIVASRETVYEKYFDIQTYEDYLTVLDRSDITELFWFIPSDVNIADEFNFDAYFTHDNEYDRKINHVFLNGEHYDGIMLLSKHKKISKKEFNHRFLVEKKEWNVIASTPKQFDRFVLNSYDDYENAIKASSTEMFWGLWSNIEVINESIFDLYFSHHNSYDRAENHVFKHIFRQEETYNNGIVLFSKNKIIRKKEFDYRFLIQKKEHDIISSKLKPYDIIFISYNEPNADKNWQELKTNFPRALRVHGVKGIHQAHIKSAEIATTEMFWVVDADAIIESSFNFDYEVSAYENNTVHVWRSRNPINDLSYGYGGVKLLPRELTVGMDVTTSDMTTSISKNFKIIDQISNITEFNTDPFNTWKSAFRECVKLSSRTIDRQDDEETIKRLDIWCSVGYDKPFGEYALKGAKAGKEYGEKCKGNKELLAKINDFDWLRRQYDI
jgi:hypothetical protein